MLYIKALCLPVSEKKNFKVCHLCFYVPTCDPLDGVSFDLGGIIRKTLGGGPLGGATQKYQS